GNGAYDQFQLDIYGEALNTMYEARVHHIVDDAPIAWTLITAFVDCVERSWQRPDEGIWEIRGHTRRHFVHSKLMAWVAVDRGVRFVEEFGATAPEATRRRIHRWRALREEIRHDIVARGFDPRVGAFTQ